MMFALVFQVFGLVWLVPTVGPLLRVGIGLASIVAAWIAVQEALDLRRRAALLLPFSLALVVALGLIAADLIVNGIDVTIESILLRLGIARGA
jgi:hypothetical protein